MERGVTGYIDHSATFWFCWSELISSLSFFLILVGDAEGKTGMETDRRREERRVVAITTPWPPGSPGLH